MLMQDVNYLERISNTNMSFKGNNFSPINIIQCIDEDEDMLQGADPDVAEVLVVH